MATTLLEHLSQAPGKRDRVLDDCVLFIDAEVSSKSGLLALPLKAGYSVVKGLKPGFVRHAMDFLLDDFCRALEPNFRAWADAPPSLRGSLPDSLKRDGERAANALLSVTDKRAERSTHTTLRSLYGKLRGAAKTHVIAALPGLGRMMQNHVVLPSP